MMGNSSLGKDTINFEAWTKENPDVGHFIVFGYQCYAHIFKGEQQKSDGKAKRITLGYGT